MQILEIGVECEQEKCLKDKIINNKIYINIYIKDIFIYK
jgi:hypothetical protein